MNTDIIEFSEKLPTLVKNVKIRVGYPTIFVGNEIAVLVHLLSPDTNKDQGGELVNDMLSKIEHVGVLMSDSIDESIMKLSIHQLIRHYGHLESSIDDNETMPRLARIVREVIMKDGTVFVMTEGNNEDYSNYLRIFNNPEAFEYDEKKIIRF